MSEQTPRRIPESMRYDEVVTWLAVEPLLWEGRMSEHEHVWVRIYGDGPGREMPPQDPPARLDECALCSAYRDADDPIWRPA